MIENSLEILYPWLIGLSFVFLLVVFATGWLRPAVALGGVIITLLFSGVLSWDLVASSALNQGVITVMMLIALTTIIKTHFNPLGALGRWLGHMKNPNVFSAALLSSVSGLSAFINNTPVVSLLIPYLKEWSAAKGWNPSRFLLPISFMAVIGGMFTLIGTSTNMVLQGFLLANNYTPFGFWEFAPLALSIAVPAVILLVILSAVLFKTKAAPDKQRNTRRTYTTELKVVAGGHLDGQRIADAGLRNLKGLFITDVYREGNLITAVDSSFVLQGNDYLFLSGDSKAVTELLHQQENGLVNAEHKHGIGEKRPLVEVLVGNNSPLVGKTVKESQFRNQVDGAIVGVLRAGHVLQGKIGRHVLKTGDLLLVSPGASFDGHLAAFGLLKVSDTPRPSVVSTTAKGIWLTGALVVGALGASFGWPIYQVLLGMIALAVALGLGNVEQLKNGFNIQLYAILALSVAYGTMLVQTDFIAAHSSSIPLPEDPRWAVLGLFGLTVILTNTMSNISAVSMAFPLGVMVLNHYGIPAHTVFIPLAFGASAAFLTPVSYQTHLMVMGPGKYSQGDFLKLGLPILLVYCVICALQFWHLPY